MYDGIGAKSSWAAVASSELKGNVLGGASLVRSPKEFRRSRISAVSSGGGGGVLEVGMTSAVSPIVARRSLTFGRIAGRLIGSDGRSAA